MGRTEIEANGSGLPVRVAHLIYSQAVGGSEIVAVNVCAGFNRRDFEPIILFLYDRPGPMEKILSDLDISYYCLKMSRWRRCFRPFIIASTLNRLKIDILHIHHLNFYQQVIGGARLSRIKGIVYTEHSFRDVDGNFKRQNELRKAVKTVDCCTVITKNMRDRFVHDFHVDPSKIQVIYNGVDCDRFSPEDNRSDPQGLPKNIKGTVLLSVARLVEEKDHFSLLAAVKILLQKGLDVFLILVGAGKLQKEIEKKIEELNLQDHVVMVGAKSNIADYLFHADIFVLSSKSEGLPMVILEAMASGTPVVATDVGGISEIVLNEKTGLLVPPQDPESLATAIEMIIEKPGLAEELSRNSRELMLSSFEQQKITKSYCALYSRILR